MNETKDRNSSQTAFSDDAVANPKETDLEAWNALSDDEKRAHMIAQLDAAENEGLATKRPMEDLIAEYCAPKREHDL